MADPRVLHLDEKLLATDFVEEELLELERTVFFVDDVAGRLDVFMIVISVVRRVAGGGGGGGGRYAVVHCRLL